MNIKTLLHEANISKILEIKILKDSLKILMLSSDNDGWSNNNEYSLPETITNHFLIDDWELGYHSSFCSSSLGNTHEYIFKIKYSHIVKLLTYTFPCLKSIILTINIDDIIYNFIEKYKDINIELFLKIETFEDFANLIKYNLNFCKLLCVQFEINEITYKNYKNFCNEIVKNCETLEIYFGQLYILDDTIIKVEQINDYDKDHLEDINAEEYLKCEFGFVHFEHHFENKNFTDQFGKNVHFSYTDSPLKVLPTFNGEDYIDRISVFTKTNNYTS